MAATIMINALTFHQNLAGQHGVRSLGQIDGIQACCLQIGLSWRNGEKILECKLLVHLQNRQRPAAVNIKSVAHAMRALKVMSDTSTKLVGLGVSQSHDLTGTVFQRLIADRKFLATFYTRPESAALLAHLAIPDDGDWGAPERVKNFRIADYACGTGTLIHAAYRRLNQLHWLAGGNPEELHAHMMEHGLTACDVLPSSVHLTASMLSATYPSQLYGDTRTIVMDYGRTDRGEVSIGSLDLLGGSGKVKPAISLNRPGAVVNGRLFAENKSKKVTGKGEAESKLHEDMPPNSQDLVIMNPPFTRAGSDWQIGNPQGYDTKTFHGLSTDTDAQASGCQHWRGNMVKTPALMATRGLLHGLRLWLTTWLGRMEP